MPWHVVAESSQCPASKPYAVIKDADGSLAGCHATRTQANAQVAALYATETVMTKGTSMNLEHRTVRAEVRAPAEGRTFEATVMRYGIVDDYDTVFDPGVFTRSLESRMPRLTWGHDWADLIGRVVDYKDTDESLAVVGELDDFDAVPRARQAYAQLQSGTLDNFSVGFRRSETRDNEGRTHFVTATLDEVALVLSGAVPGTETLAVRSPMVRVRSGLEVPVATLIEIARQKAAGLLTDEEAGIALGLAAGEGALNSPGGSGGGSGAGGPGEPPVPDELDGDALEALDLLGLG